MRIGFYLIGLGMLACIGFLVWTIKIGWSEHKMRKAYNRAIENERNHQGEVWKETAAVNYWVNLYMSMVTKHGPDSEEANAFRFGSDNLIAKFLKDTAANEAFKKHCNIIDETWRNIYKHRG